jgi:hypothetical protein
VVVLHRYDGSAADPAAPPAVQEKGWDTSCLFDMGNVDHATQQRHSMDIVAGGDWPRVSVLKLFQLGG